MNSTYYWTGRNNSTYLRGLRKAATKLTATREALNFLRGELMGEGSVSVFDGKELDYPLVTFERSIHTKYRCVRHEIGKADRSFSL